MQSFLIREIQSTNSIENIQSTRHDIFHLIQNQLKGADKKIISIANAYSVLLDGQVSTPDHIASIRSIYDQLLSGAVDKADLPDGTYFRTRPVFITDGINTVHKGFEPESAVNKGMEEFLNLYRNKTINVYERSILSHFLFETIHPFYDSNGRLGRFLLTLLLFEETGSRLAFCTAAAINQNRSSYYKAFRQANHIHMYGSLNAYFEDMAIILHTYFESVIQDFHYKKNRIDSISFSDAQFTRSEQKILRLLAESSLLSEFGITNQEIIKYGNVSKRTVISAIQKFREKDLLEDMNITGCAVSASDQI